MNGALGRKSTILFLVVAVVIAFGVGFYAGKMQVPPAPPQGVTNITEGQPQGVDFSLFWDAWRAVEEKFVHANNLNYQNMVYGAISGMVSSLGDPYTVFMNPQEAKMFLEDVGGSFEGVGMEIGIKNKQLQVISPLPGTPAAKAGIRAGDKILKIDGTSTENMTTDKAVSLIRGPKGSTVTLTLLRDSWDSSKDFVIQRDTIKVPSLKWEMKEGNIAYIQLFQFSEAARNDFSKAAAEMSAKGAKKIILDLRNDPGGYLEVAQDIAGWFLPRGQSVVIEDFGPNEKQNIYKAKGNGLFSSTPVIVLINEGSASAAEILAGALRDNRGIQLVGEKSFGKGSVQELERLKGGSSLKVTVADWLTPNGVSISTVGLTPDSEVRMTEDDFSKGRDPQLDKALELIKNL